MQKASNPHSIFKRRYPRRIYTNTVGVLYRGQYTLAQGSALGEGGMAFHWPHSLPVEQGAVVTFKIPGNAMISVRSEIRNCKVDLENPGSFIIGIQFLPLPIAEKRRIRAFVSSRLESEPSI